MYMTVISYDAAGNPSLQVIDILDTDYMENEGRRLVYHIGDKKYYQIANKSEMESLLEDKGFDVLDRPYLVNVSKIRYFDEKYGKAFFVENPSSNSKFVTVARAKYDFVLNFIRRSISRNNDTTQEVTVNSKKNSLLSPIKLFRKDIT